MWLKLCLALLFASFEHTSNAQPAYDSLTPPPQQIYVRLQYSGLYVPSPSQTIFLDPVAPAWEAAAALNDGLRALGLFPMQAAVWTPSDSLRPGVALGAAGAFVNARLASVPDQRIAVTASYPGAEGYVVDVLPSRAIIAGSDSAGLRYGVDRFLQLLALHSFNAVFACRIVDAPEFPVRWVYTFSDFSIPASTPAAKAVWDRARRGRLNGVHLCDNLFARPATLPAAYRDSLASLARHAGALGLRLIPAVMPFGWSNAFLANDPNLATGMPVLAQRFIVHGDTAALMPRAPVAIPNGGFERFSGDLFEGIDFVDQPGKISFADTAVRHSGRASVRFENIGVYSPVHGHARVIHSLRASPYTLYRVSAWVRTEQLAKPAIILFGAFNARTSYQLTWNDHALPETTGGWRHIEFTFNSLGADSIVLSGGTGFGKTGRFWIDDWSVEEVPLVNLIRREGAPVNVGNDRTARPYAEGVDFDTLRDPLMDLYPGQYSHFHTPPTFRILPGGGIRDGDTLSVSYHHMLNIYGNYGQVACSLSDPSVFRVLELVTRTLDSIFHPRAWFMQHDEIRVAGWDAGDRTMAMSSAQLLSWNAGQCMDLLGRISPGSGAWVWSDMFDPYHNATDSYFLVRGSLAGGAELLPRSLGIVNWNGRDSLAQQSLRHFSSLGFRQVAAVFYDEDAAQIRAWKEWARGTPGFQGMLYTTWMKDYRCLDAFIDYAWKHAPHIAHQPPLAIPADGAMPLGIRIAGDRWDSGWRATGAHVHYRLRPGAAFDSLYFVPTPGVDQTVTLSLPASSPWLQWYITASDNRGWTSKVPYGDSVCFELGDPIAASAERAEPQAFELSAVWPQPATGGPVSIALRAPAGAALDVRLINALGACVRRFGGRGTGGAQQLSLDVAGLPPGVYLCAVACGNAQRALRVAVAGQASRANQGGS